MSPRQGAAGPPPPAHRGGAGGGVGRGGRPHSRSLAWPCRPCLTRQPCSGSCGGQREVGGKARANTCCWCERQSGPAPHELSVRPSETLTRGGGPGCAAPAWRCAPLGPGPHSTELCSARASSWSAAISRTHSPTCCWRRRCFVGVLSHAALAACDAERGGGAGRQSCLPPESRLHRCGGGARCVSFWPPSTAANWAASSAMQSSSAFGTLGRSLGLQAGQLLPAGPPAGPTTRPPRRTPPLRRPHSMRWSSMAGLCQRPGKRSWQSECGTFAREAAGRRAWECCWLAAGPTP